MPFRCHFSHAFCSLREVARHGLRPTKTALLHTLLLLLVATASFAAEATINFDSDVRPIFAKHCFACHGGVKQAGGLSLIYEENFYEGSDSSPVIVRGEANDSELIHRVTENDEDVRMPPPEHGNQLSETEIETLRDWIDQGAPWELPWSFQAPIEPSVPVIDAASEAKKTNWARSDIDQFVLQRMRQAGLSPSHEATNRAWLRRVTFDLIGLPPTEIEIESFEADLKHKALRESAYEKVVDRLLQSPHYGERWASMWLDLARYADTSGYEKDTHRNMWPYRDWVIRTFNIDGGEWDFYSRFISSQLGADVSAGHSIELSVASAFHRNTPTNKEGGTDDEEFRIAAVHDRVDTTWRAIQGLTLSCAKCHDHPYDPISQEDYYRIFGTFNSTQDTDLDEEFPKLAVPDNPKDWRKARLIDYETDLTRQRLFECGVKLTSDSQQWRGLEFDLATSTEQTKLSIRPVKESINGSASDGNEVIASGTITDKSLYKAEAPAKGETITAIRIDALPKQLDEALKQPEIGFVLSRLQLHVVREDGTIEEVYFHSAYGDEKDPFFDVEETIDDSPQGWSAYSRMHHPRWAVFVVDRQINGPLKLAPQDRLRFTLKHSKKLDGQGALVLRRFRIAVTNDPKWVQLREDRTINNTRLRLAELEQQRSLIKSTLMPVMAERQENLRRPDYLFKRGNFLTKGKAIESGLPSWTTTNPISKDSAFINQPNPAGLRMLTAMLLSDEGNPFTARVWVNRIWHQLFGQGIVPTLDDFGTSGERPSHPELLDYLATRNMNKHEWQLKPLLKEIVLSSTYRQDAKASDLAKQIDPANQWLSHGPRKRLQAEMIRDQALVLSGKFNPKQFGPPVKPYQPDGVWQSVYNNQKWKTSKGNERYRRAIYTYWKRTAAYPSMRTFDVPSREICTAQRPNTNTPLQALVLLNDPVYHELAEGFAEQMLNQGGPTIESQVAWGYEQATTRQPTPAAINELSRLYRDALLETSSNQSDQDAPRQAMALVASAILNLDVTLNN